MEGSRPPVAKDFSTVASGLSLGLRSVLDTYLPTPACVHFTGVLTL